ncbi:hypothetical protein EV586_101190 [Tumebacillus sp. BK434]|uniref:hypothetical protein n=1 Tax=Tumebacillus sp. BK434 TaxID=2512169 RepID=UPI0010482B55|nr:hypothetical protein [Tumebacillus sp. BK434]TCP58991.1 hypothetical protein EV586_101190 [Tumebacillus sp. BK434]
MIKKLMAKMTSTPDATPCVYLYMEHKCVLTCAGLSGYNRTRTYFKDEFGRTCYYNDATSCGC